MRAPMRVPTIRREDDQKKIGGHGAKSAFAYPTDCTQRNDAMCQ
jgi:hypothetical protein